MPQRHLFYSSVCLFSGSGARLPRCLFLHGHHEPERPGCAAEERAACVLVPQSGCSRGPRAGLWSAHQLLCGVLSVRACAPLCLNDTCVFSKRLTKARTQLPFSFAGHVQRSHAAPDREGDSAVGDVVCCCASSGAFVFTLVACFIHFSQPTYTGIASLQQGS